MVAQWQRAQDVALFNRCLNMGLRSIHKKVQSHLADDGKSYCSSFSISDQIRNELELQICLSQQMDVWVHLLTRCWNSDPAPVNAAFVDLQRG
ncbi:jg13189 [Pararge aegeria aegeria]|uniref:Jg13189 protein n=1 Tax=Pararge aegeria aegeria TaxID=348720 RepID=A0A8S4RAI5_9NEOP|nr:jg13189 [Pararge aegeria aegeria]